MRSIYFRLFPEILSKLIQEGWDLTDLEDITRKPYMFKQFFPKSTISAVKILGYGPPTPSGTIKIGKYDFPKIDSADAPILKTAFAHEEIKDATMFKDLFPDMGIEKIIEDFPRTDTEDTETPEKMILKIAFRDTDIETLKEDSIPFAAHYAPHIRLLEILPLDLFLCFVIILGAKNKWWMLRFWDLRVGRSISVGREHAQFYNSLLSMLTIPHQWAGVEATPPTARVPKGVTPLRTVRVGLYRYPTASISVRVGSQRRRRYKLIERIWENFLLKL